MARMLINPDTALDDMWVYVVTHGGKNFALFPYISAMMPVRTLASICHQIDGMGITKEGRRELSTLIKRRGANAGWAFDGMFAWLVTPMERDNVARRQITIHTETRTAAPRRKPPKALLRERHAAAKSKIRSPRG